MTKPKTSIKTFLLCSLLGASIGFFLGGGWRIFFDFSEWRYETFYRADGLELFLLAVWFWAVPGLATAIGFIAGGLIAFFMKSPTSQSKS